MKGEHMRIGSMKTILGSLAVSVLLWAGPGIAGEKETPPPVEKAAKDAKDAAKGTVDDAKKAGDETKKAGVEAKKAGVEAKKAMGAAAKDAKGIAGKAMEKATDTGKAAGKAVTEGAEKAKGKGQLAQEKEKHIKRMAQIDRLEKLGKNVASLREKEKARHERVLARLGGKEKTAEPKGKVGKDVPKADTKKK
jgi:hypothetical protein